MGYSTKIYFRKDYIKENGTCAIYLQIIIDRKKKLIPLQIYWPADKCDDTQRLCLPRHKGDKEVDDINVILRDNVSRANEIFRTFRLSRQFFTMDTFMVNWENEFSRESFIEYYEQKLKFRLKTGDIGHITYKNHNCTLNWLKRYKKDLKFMEMDQEWAYKFDAFLAKRIKTRDGDTHNSRWGYHKNIKAMLKIAAKHDKIRFNDPYEFFEIQPKRGTWGAILTEDINKLFDYYQITRHPTERKALRRFLFSIATSLRISDLRRLELDWRHGNVLKFTPKKGSRKKPKPVEIPLSRLAQYLWDQAKTETSSSRIFEEVCEQYSNRILRRIGEHLNIKTRLHHHVGRHSWVTNFLNNEGSLRAAQKILNHFNLKTTMVYDHMNFDQVQKETHKMEFISNL